MLPETGKLHLTNPYGRIFVIIDLIITKMIKRKFRDLIDDFTTVDQL